MNIDDQIQRKRKKSVTVIVCIIDVFLLIMSVSFFLKADHVGGLVAVGLFVLFTVILFIMLRTKIYSSNWKA